MLQCGLKPEFLRATELPICAREFGAERALRMLWRVTRSDDNCDTYAQRRSLCFKDCGGLAQRSAVDIS